MRKWILTIMLLIIVLVFGCASDSDDNLSAESAEYWRTEWEKQNQIVGWMVVKEDASDAAMGAVICAYEISQRRGDNVVRAISGLHRKHLGDDFSKIPETFEEEAKWISYAVDVKALHHNECYN